MITEANNNTANVASANQPLESSSVDSSANQPQSTSAVSSSAAGVPKNYTTAAASLEATLEKSSKEIIGNALSKASEDIDKQKSGFFNKIVGGLLKPITKGLIEGLAKFFVESSDEAQGVLNVYQNIKDGYGEAKQNAENFVSKLPKIFGIRKVATNFVNGITNLMDSTFDAIDDSLLHNVFKVISDPEAISGLMDTVKVVGESFDYNPLDAIKAIIGPTGNIANAMFNPQTVEQDRPYGEWSGFHDPKGWGSFIQNCFMQSLPIDNPSYIPEGEGTDIVFMKDPEIIPNLVGNNVTQEDIEAHKNEEWFHINGMGIDQIIAEKNARMFSDMIDRPINLIHNTNDGFVIDILECSVSKTSDETGLESPSAAMMTQALTKSLMNPEKDKTGLIAYSHGTIITDNTLNNLYEMVGKTVDPNSGKVVDDGTAGARTFTAEDLSKLEVYTFANCADNMKTPDELKGVVYMEHWVNENDLVARLGVLNDENLEPQTDKFEGNIYVREGGWGHMIGEAYYYDGGLYNSETTRQEWGEEVTGSRLYQIMMEDEEYRKAA